MNAEKKPYLKRIVLSLSAFIVLLVAFTVATNIAVVRSTKTRIYADTESIPHNKAALLLGTNPLNRQGRPNTYFTNRINAAAKLYHAGKVDFIIASGDNHTEQYDEPTAIRDSLIAHGVPENRIILDYAGFRTLDSVVRAKEIFGCDSITIISQADHCARALYLAKSNGMEAVAFPAQIRAGRLVKTRLTLREWLARDKMMLDIWLGKRPHFLGERIEIPDITPQKSYSTAEGITIRIAKPDVIKTPVDSLIVEFRNTRKEDGLTGEYFKIERLSSDSKWEELPLHREYEDEELSIVFNAVGWIVSPDTTFHMTVRPWFHEKEWKPGTYRLAKTFRFPPYPSTHKSDTAYVEFQIK